MFRFYLNGSAALGLCFAFLISPARAHQHALPENINAIAVSESNPFVFPPLDFQATDFAIEPVDQVSDPEISIRLSNETLQWIRVAQILVVPRAQLIVELNGNYSGTVSNAKHIQAFQKRAEITILLMSGKSNSILVEYQDSQGKIRRKTYGVRFRPHNSSLNGAVATDVSCSPFRVDAKMIQATEGTWAYVGCRYIHEKGEQFDIPALEVLVYWDAPEESVSAQGIPITPSSTSIWSFRQRALPGKIELARGKTQLKVQYAIADRDRKISLSAGVGPYQYALNDASSSVNTYTALLTGYWSYFMGETVRIVGFFAAPIYKRSFFDMGIYLWTEQFRLLDDRLSMNLLLGGHAIGFTSAGTPYFSWSIPQGVEIVFRDFLNKRRNLTAGGFLYPEISNRMYYNLWLRWGSSAYFAELNYIAWHEPTTANNSVYSRSAGISFGFPLIKLF